MPTGKNSTCRYRLELRAKPCRQGDSPLSRCQETFGLWPGLHGNTHEQFGDVPLAGGCLLDVKESPVDNFPFIFVYFVEDNECIWPDNREIVVVTS